MSELDLARLRFARGHGLFAAAVRLRRTMTRRLSSCSVRVHAGFEIRPMCPPRKSPSCRRVVFLMIWRTRMAPFAFQRTRGTQRHRVRRGINEGEQVCMDSLLEGTGFELVWGFPCRDHPAADPGIAGFGEPLFAPFGAALVRRTRQAGVARHSIGGHALAATAPH